MPSVSMFKPSSVLPCLAVTQPSAQRAGAKKDGSPCSSVMAICISQPHGTRHRRGEPMLFESRSAGRTPVVSARVAEPLQQPASREPQLGQHTRDTRGYVPDTLVTIHQASMRQRHQAARLSPRAHKAKASARLSRAAGEAALIITMRRRAARVQRSQYLCRRWIPREPGTPLRSPARFAGRRGPRPLYLVHTVSEPASPRHRICGISPPRVPVSCWSRDASALVSAIECAQAQLTALPPDGSDQGRAAASRQTAARDSSCPLVSAATRRSAERSPAIR